MRFLKKTEKQHQRGRGGQRKTDKVIAVNGDCLSSPIRKKLNTAGKKKEAVEVWTYLLLKYTIVILDYNIALISLPVTSDRSVALQKWYALLKNAYLSGNDLRMSSGLQF